MLRKRIACGILILSALILYIFSNETVTLALLLTLIVIPAASAGLLALSGRHLEISLGEEVRAGADPDRHTFILRIKNPDILPVASVDVEVRCVNLRTGETDGYVLSRYIGPKGKAESRMEVVPGHAGRYEISVVSAGVSDPLGLWSRTLKCDGERHITSMPEIFDIQMSYASSAAMLENDRFAASARGSDPGDITGIREYVPGDPVRNIHWKLSEKTGKLLIKELGNPITDQFLVICDTAPDIAQDPYALDAAAAVYTSVLHSFIRDGIPVAAGWTDPLTGRAEIRRIQEENDISAAAAEYLAVPARSQGAFARIERDIAESRYAHMIIVGSRIPAGIEAISNGCQVTLLLYGIYGGEGGANVAITGFDAKTYRDELSGIEV